MGGRNRRRKNAAGSASASASQSRSENALSPTTASSTASINSFESDKNGLPSESGSAVSFSLTDADEDGQGHQQEYDGDDDDSHLAVTSADPDFVDEERAARRRMKKERQKEKKMGRRLAAQRKESMMILLQDGTISTDTLLLAGSGPGSAAALLQQQRKISLLRCPQVTLEYFLREICCLVGEGRSRLGSAIFGNSSGSGGRNLSDVLRIIGFSLLLGVGLVGSYLWTIVEDEHSMKVKQTIAWYAYWILLGVLSSIGFGTGLHTFVLYLGPFIAKVTLAAEECSTVEFPSPPYPNQIICPSEDPLIQGVAPSIWQIFNKVRWESFAWGFGTALGELPPYFVAKAARLSGLKDADAEEEDGSGCCLRRCLQNCVKNFVKNVGFWGILLCASVPNPLFDLAGITCGHFLVPFLTFFGATFMGKCVIKSQLQTAFVVLAFNENSLASVLNHIGRIPHVGEYLQGEFTQFMDYQRASVHDKTVSKSGGTLKILMDVLLLLMIIYFITSIVNGLARAYHKRITPKLTGRKAKERKTRKWLKLNDFK